MEQKKKQLTKAQLESRLKRAVIHLDTTKSTKSIYFSDKGLRLTVDDDEGYALIATGFHTHYFQNWTSEGISRPFLYTKRIIEIANENDCKVGDGYSYQRLMQVLKDKEDQSDYNIATYYDWWLFIIFNPLYSIAENEVSSWLVFFKYVQSLATSSILLEEHTKDVTNKQFIEKFKALIDEFTKEVDERVVLHKLTDDEFAKEQIDALQQDENETIIKENLLNKKNDEDNG